jgi:polysaccharide export outer membrane protein
MKIRITFLLAAFVACAPALLAAQTTNQLSAKAPAAAAASPAYVIGPEDELVINFWREADMSAEVVVRPDGKISLPLLNEFEAAGLTPAELLDRILERARAYVDNPSATVVVRAIKSRKVFVTGSVTNPGAYPLTSPTTVLQLLAMAGGLTEWAKSDRIVIVRTSGGRQSALPFNYEDVGRSRNLAQNILLEPGDTVIVPK